MQSKQEEVTTEDYAEVSKIEDWTETKVWVLADDSDPDHRTVAPVDDLSRHIGSIVTAFSTEERAKVAIICARNDGCEMDAFQPTQVYMSNAFKFAEKRNMIVMLDMFYEDEAIYVLHAGGVLRVYLQKD